MGGTGKCPPRHGGASLPGVLFCQHPSSFKALLSMCRPTLWNNVIPPVGERSPTPLGPSVASHLTSEVRVQVTCQYLSLQCSRTFLSSLLYVLRVELRSVTAAAGFENQSQYHVVFSCGCDGFVCRTKHTICMPYMYQKDRPQGLV